MPDNRTPQRPKGRTLGEFFDDLGCVFPAERKLLDACAMGDSAEADKLRPKQMTEENRVRPGLLRFLLLGGDENAAVHEKGVQLKGAWIENDIDLQDCRVRVPLSLTRCHVDGKVVLRGTDVPHVTIEDSFVKGIDGDHLRCRGNLQLNECSNVEGSVELTASYIAVRDETARVHHPARWGGSSVAARGAGAAGGYSSGWCALLRFIRDV
jgi:hypothetical protein